nr:type II toxin-antitoxin system RelE/ParE family toxin [Halomicroarcula sp. DFY41]
MKLATASVSTRSEDRPVAHEVVLTETVVETLEQFEPTDTDRIITKLEEIGDFPDYFLDRLKNHPGYKLRVGDFRILIDWDKENEVLYAIDAFKRKTEYRELGKYREVWGSWRDDLEETKDGDD